MARTDFVPTLEFDLANDGSWSTDESARFLSASINRGRADALSRFPPGSMILTMQNRDGRFSPLKGTLAGLDSYIPVRLYVTWTTPAVTNLDENPASEDNIDGWTIVSGFGSIARDTTDSWTGSACAKLTLLVAGDVIAKRRVSGGTLFTVSPSVPYTWRQRLKGSVTGKVDVRIDWFSSVPAFISSETKTIDLTTDWAAAFITGTAPGTAAFARLVILYNDTALDVFEDASFFYQSATLLPYVDGRQPGCSWASTEDASQSSRSANPDFLLFDGFFFDFDIAQDARDRTAIITCRDRMALLSELPLSMGAVGAKKTGDVIDRILDHLQGNLIENWSNEWTDSSGNPNALWASVNTGLIGEVAWVTTEDFDDSSEGDSMLGISSDGSPANQGGELDIFGDVTAADDYRIVCYARMRDATRNVTFSVRDDGSEIATVTKSITATGWTRVPLDFTLTGAPASSLVYRVIIDGAVTDRVDIDPVFCIERSKLIERSLDVGQATIPFVAAYDEPAVPVIDAVVDSEPGQLYVRAKGLAGGGEIVFHDRLHRDNSPFIIHPRLILGDGDGLLRFAADKGLRTVISSRDRISAAVVTSRGTLAVKGKSVAWELSPTRSLSVGDEFRARYGQIIMDVTMFEKAGAVLQENRNYALGFDVLVATGDSDAFFAARGNTLEYPTEQSAIRKEDATLAFRRELPVAMPLQGTNSSDMDTEAQRLLDKYKNRVLKLAVLMTQQEGDGGDEDLPYAFQLDLDIDESVGIRAESEPHSPGINDTFWVEGLSHQLTKGMVLATSLKLEER